MAHEIEDNNAFYTVKPAWHGLGEVLKDAPTIDQAWRLAYPHELFKLDIKADLCGNLAEVETHKAIFRSDGKLIGVVGSGYELVQPYDAFKFFEPFIESNEVTLEAGGSLRNGSRMWALAKIKDVQADILPNDRVDGYFLVYTSFDGSLSHGIQFTSTRVVCANTLAIAQGEDSAKSGYKLRHTKSIHDRIEQVKTNVDLAKRTFNKSVEHYRHLATKQMTRSEQVEYVTKCLTPKTEDKELSTRCQNQITYVIDLLDNQKGLELVPAMRGTAWQAYNAMSEYYTHEYGRSQDTRVDSNWFGPAARLNQDAMRLAVAH